MLVRSASSDFLLRWKDTNRILWHPERDLPARLVVVGECSREQDGSLVSERRQTGEAVSCKFEELSLDDLLSLVDDEELVLLVLPPLIWLPVVGHQHLRGDVEQGQLLPDLSRDLWHGTEDDDLGAARLVLFDEVPCKL